MFTGKRTTAGCALVRDPAALRNAFSYHPPYYSFDVEATNYYDLGPQYSRGFSRTLCELATELQALTHNLSITTLPYIPLELRASVGSEQTEAYLDRLNQLLLTLLENSGEAFCSNALIGGKCALRFCIVNFRTSTGDIEAVPPLVARLGRQAHAEISPQ